MRKITISFKLFYFYIVIRLCFIPIARLWSIEKNKIANRIEEWNEHYREILSSGLSVTCSLNGKAYEDLVSMGTRIFPQLESYLAEHRDEEITALPWDHLLNDIFRNAMMYRKMIRLPDNREEREQELMNSIKNYRN